MKIITISKIGYNAPSQANWAWGIWKVDTIQTEKGYSMSYTVKEAFGGDSRFRARIEELTGVKVNETKGVYPTQKITGVRSMEDMESEEFISKIVEFIKN